MRVIGFNAGQFGDLAMNLIACRSLKELYPDVKITFGIGERYAAAAPIFKHNKFIDSIHIWGSYNEWPDEIDLDYLKSNKFDIVFDAMPRHYDEHWYLKRHQTEEVCLTHKLPVPKDLQIDLNKWFSSIPIYKDCVAIAGHTSFGGIKNLTEEQLKTIVNVIKSLGLIPIQLGAPEDPKIEGVEKLNLNYFAAVQAMAACRALICADTGMNWIASGYKHKVLGLYGWGFYPFAKTSKNWQPVNPNAAYIEAAEVKDIPIDKIVSGVERLIG